MLRMDPRLALLLLLLCLGGCTNAGVAPMAIAPQPAVQPAQPAATPIKSYGQSVRSFDRSLTRAEKSAVVAELQKDIARHKAARQQ